MISGSVVKFIQHYAHGGKGRRKKNVKTANKAGPKLLVAGKFTRLHRKLAPGALESFMNLEIRKRWTLN